uniref:Uncharacterized protein n=1 Tax=Arundo donax TaxID=35708 RepID=A0A0A9DT42_ARUDO
MLITSLVPAIVESTISLLLKHLCSELMQKDKRSKANKCSHKKVISITEQATVIFNYNAPRYQQLNHKF